MPARAASESARENAPLLRREDRDGVAWLTLNRPEHRNALSLDLIGELLDEVGRLGRDASVRVVVISGAGRTFCAGHDLKELRANPSPQYYERVFTQSSQLMQAITRLPKPVIARVHGVATAAGCQLVATCDLAVAARSTKFATPGVDIGLFCSTPMVALSRAVGRKPAMEMLLTGDLIDAETARSYGLINRVVDDARLDEETAALASKVASKPPLIVATGKEAFYHQAELGLADAYAYASGVMARNMMEHDAREGIDAFLGKRNPNWRGS
jgi:enoyl-CoA hydratase/carnithine racemase